MEDISGVKEALERLPQAEHDARWFRIKRVCWLFFSTPLLFFSSSFFFCHSIACLLDATGHELVAQAPLSAGQPADEARGGFFYPPSHLNLDFFR